MSLGLDENDSKKTTLEVYRQYFEKPFVTATEVYYKMESEKFLSENSVTEYMKKVIPIPSTPTTDTTHPYALIFEHVAMAINITLSDPKPSTFFVLLP